MPTVLEGLSSIMFMVESATPDTALRFEAAPGARVKVIRLEAAPFWSHFVEFRSARSSIG